MKRIIFEPIGIVHTPFVNRADVPKQSYLDKGTTGTIEVYPKYQDGLLGLEAGQKIILIFNFHLSDGFDLHQYPHGQSQEKGVFAIRSPYRPNAIGLSAVDLDKIEKNILYISNIDILDGTPLLDIKPYLESSSNVDKKRMWIDSI